MGIPLRVLIVEDSAIDTELLVLELQRAGYDPTYVRVETSEAMATALTQPWDVVISDYTMPRFDALAALALVKASGQDLPFIIVSGTIGEALAVAAMQAGAHDYLMKDRIARLGPAVARTLHEAAERRVRLQMEQALQASEMRFRTVADAAPVLLWMAGPDMGYTYCNQGWLEFTGRTLQQELGYGWAESVYPDDYGPCLDLYITACTARQPFEMEYRLRRADGAYRWVLDRGVPLLTPAGHCTGYIGSAIDITSRKEAEQILQQAQEELERRVQERTAALHQAMAERQRLEREAQRAQHFVLLGRLAAGVSHEIRNPLGALFLHVDLLAEELHQPSSDSAAVIPETLAEIKTQLARLDDLVQDYLSLVRVAQIERAPQDLGVALQTWVAEWQTMAADRGMTLQCNGLADLGVVALHPSTLRRALLNLVQNAFEAMSAGGALTMVGHSSATHVQIEVQDTGSGMAAEQLGQIFEPLYTTKPGGTGLGLHIVQEIVAAHGGQVSVESVSQQGTTFTVTLPRAATALS